MNEDESCQWQTHISTIHRVPSNSSQCNFELFFDGELVPENLKPTFDNKDMDEKIEMENNPEGRMATTMGTITFG